MGDENLRVIGLALKSEKWKKHINQNLIEKARQSGFVLKQLNAAVPLEEQGRLDAVLQKLRKPDWEEQLERYAEAHPDVKVFDRPAATLPIRNRGTMLTMLEGEGWAFTEPAADPQVQLHSRRYLVQVPTHTTLQEGTAFPDAVQQLEAADLRYPLLAKPVWADGREGSHSMAVVGTEAGLQRLVDGDVPGDFGLPVLVQQYVDHGGCLFKVYVLGSTVVMVKRSSLQLPPCSAASCAMKATAMSPPAAAISSAAACSLNGATMPPGLAGLAANGSAAHTTPQRELAAARDPLPTQTPSPEPSAVQDVGPPLDLELIDRVSAYPRCKSWGRWDLAPKGHGVVSPPMWLIQALAQRLRRHLGLNLFNFDVIVPLPVGPAVQQQQQQQIGRLNGSSGGGIVNGSPRGPAQQQQVQEQEQQEPQPAQPPTVFYVIDINYFPGYEKLPGYEDLMVQFFSSIWAEGGDGIGIARSGSASIA